jgi:hypothetical protein
MIQDQEIVSHNTLSSTLQTDAADQTSPGSASSRTTMGRTVLIGSAGDGGYRQLTAGPGEPHIVRSDIIGATFTTLTYALTAFAQMTDLHIVDDQSPLRVELSRSVCECGTVTLRVVPDERCVPGSRILIDAGRRCDVSTLRQRVCHQDGRVFRPIRPAKCQKVTARQLIEKR